MQKLSRATSIFLDRFQCSPGRPDLNRLGLVAERFAELPWENLTKYLRKHLRDSRAESDPGRPYPDLPGAEKLRLSAEVLSDHARYGTGGTCFSLTNALRRIVTDLGFHAYPVMADMRHGRNIHCALLVELDQRKILVDPGYLVAEPVVLRPRGSTRVALPGHHLEYRTVPQSGEIELFTANLRGEEIFRYRLRPRAIPEAQFARHWVDSFDASGMNGLHLNRISGDARLSAHDLNLRIDTGRAKTNVKLRDGYAREISERFGVDRDLAGRAFEEWERRRCPDR